MIDRAQCLVPQRFLPLLVLAVVLSACSNRQRLGEYDFRQRTLAVAPMALPAPDVLSGLRVEYDADDPVRSILRTGGSFAREASATGVRARLDSAVAGVDIADRMSDRVLEGASRHLRTQPVTDGRRADFEIEIRVLRYGIVASSWQSQAYYNIEADLWLLDGSTGRRIWKSGVRATDRISPATFGDDADLVSDVVTAWALSRLSAADIERALLGLSDFAADHLIRELARSLDDARG